VQRGIVTKISVYEDSPTAIASRAYGANLDSIAFNLDYIGSRSPELVQELILLFEKCKKLRRPHGKYSN
jgi:hypothetical protein